jgi:hypothetical protein
MLMRCTLENPLQDVVVIDAELMPPTHGALSMKTPENSVMATAAVASGGAHEETVIPTHQITRSV